MGGTPLLRHFIARRLLILMFQMIGLSLAVFITIRLLPADPVARLVGMNASRDSYEQASHALGLDRSLPQQLGNYLGIHSDTGQRGILQGDFGHSWSTTEPVLDELAAALPVTLELVTWAMALSLLIAIPLGLASARKPGGVADRIAIGWGLFAGAQPDYWWGLLFLYVFFFLLGIAPPPMGRLDPIMMEPHAITGFMTIDTLLAGDISGFFSALHHLMLPVLTLVFGVSGAMVKMVRSSTMRVLESDYILYARASGLSEKQVARYALRAALTPTVTLLGIFYGIMVSSVVAVEIIFSLEGIGQYAVRAVLNFDYPAIEGTVIAVALVSLFIYLALDILHVFLDPRIRV
jgi:ABC-type dipeptide/oligopeptide/nickel transport system permease component